MLCALDKHLLLPAAPGLPLQCMMSYYGKMARVLFVTACCVDSLDGVSRAFCRVILT